ncbi:MAG: transporter substrate-binding domain-containing protein [Pseudomonadota bacterium]
MPSTTLCATGLSLRCLLLACTALAPAAHGETSIRVVTETSSYAYQKGERVEGSATEVVEKTLAAAGQTDYQVRLYPWARAYDMALNEPDVLIFLLARTPARELQFKWAGEIKKIQYHLFRLRERTHISVKSLADARNYTVGVVRDDVRQQFLQGKGFARLAVSAQWIDSFNKLIQHQVDLVPLADDGANLLCTEARFDCTRLEKVWTLDEISTGLYMAYSMATADSTVQKTRTAFDRLKADGTVRRIMERKP